MNCCFEYIFRFSKLTHENWKICTFFVVFSLLHNSLTSEGTKKQRVHTCRCFIYCCAWKSYLSSMQKVVMKTRRNKLQANRGQIQNTSARKACEVRETLNFPVINARALFNKKMYISHSLSLSPNLLLLHYFGNLNISTRLTPKVHPSVNVYAGVSHDEWLGLADGKTGHHTSKLYFKPSSL